jgi:restriction endonuclease S subunit
MKISDFASVKSGLVLSRKASNNDIAPGHGYKLMNLKCIKSDGTIDKNELETFCSQEELSGNYLTIPGDILVRLVLPNTAVLITDDLAGLVFSSHFCRIRIHADRVLPEFLHWYLNSDLAKRQTQKDTMGTVVSAIRSGSVGELNLKIPSMEKQKDFVNLYRISLKEIELLEELTHQKELYYKKALKAFYYQFNAGDRQ